ncbi:hypothetical protein [Embleya sp. NPDC020630]|uniref:hypothetical protein n=1 Tax=Embleya sp. NPDC020630 TaxID=3363979 RepID=UPI00379AEFE1
MPSIRLNNDTAAMLAVWVEPWGTDHWMRPHEKFTLLTGDGPEPDPDDVPFDVVFHDEGVSVWVNGAYEATVHDESGAEVSCGHQRPLDVMRAWTESAEAAAVADRPYLTPEIREMARRHAEDMRRALTEAEAAAAAAAEPAEVVAEVEGSAEADPIAEPESTAEADMSDADTAELGTRSGPTTPNGADTTAGR